MRPGVMALLTGAFLLTLAWGISPQAARPIYDGIIVVQPYRYLHPPPGAPATQPPTSAQDVVHVSGTVSPTEYLTTGDIPPQAILAFADGALRLPPGTRTITFSVRPVPPPASITDGTLDGNVYLFGATSNTGAQLSVVPKVGGRIELRKTGSETGAVAEQFVAGKWVQRPSQPFVNFNYVAVNITGLGFYALVLHGKGSSAGGNNDLLFLIIGVVIILLAAAGLIAIRLTRAAPQQAA